MAYAFDFINIDGSIDHFDLGLFGDDAQALLQARAALLASTSANAVDVWHKGQLVGRIQSPHERRRPMRDASLHRRPSGNR
jgi:hypothetical protein